MLRVKVSTISPLLPFALVALLFVIASCSSDSGITRTKVPNALPDTKLTGQSPAPADSGFVMHLAWSGSDPDGKVVGFRWKMSSNGADGLGLRDTLTVDPANGDTLNPWRATAATESTFVVTADLPGFPPDDALPPRDQRSYQSHTFFVRAVDNEGGTDPTPAMVSFTATTVCPTIVIDRPPIANYYTAQVAPPTVTFGWTGTDPDFSTGVPTRVRYLFKRGQLPHGEYCVTRYDFEHQLEDLCSFDDPAWSDWLPYRQRAEDRTATLRDLPARDEQGRQIAYLFAVQAMDTAGAVTPDRTYGRNVANFLVSDILYPMLTVYEPYLGTTVSTGLLGSAAFDIAPGQPVEFQWVAESTYMSGIAAYRYGWDVADAADADDPGWVLPPGDTPEHRHAPARAFAAGTHTLTVQAWDLAEHLTQTVIVLNVVPVPSPAARRPLLVVDDVVDHASAAWVGSDGVAYDNDLQRDAFWRDALAGTGGVAGFNPATDVIDLEGARDFGFRDVVNYRAIVWQEKKAATSYTWSNFDPRSGDKYIWLGSYQQYVGHLFLCGQQALRSFTGDPAGTDGSTSYGLLSPIIFDAPLVPLPSQYQPYAYGFGWRTLPDGTRIMEGKTRYPYRFAGIDALDAASPLDFVYPLSAGRGVDARKVNCQGLMGVVIDPDFRAAHGGAGVPDTILTSLVIDYRDRPSDYPARPRLEDSFAWGLDEFYDTNVTTLPALVNPQVLPDGRQAVESMWRFESRLDWIDRVHAAHGDDGWPGNAYTPDQLRTACGSLAFGTDGRAAANAAPVGFVSHLTEATKPSPGGDVFWGFDPSRFDPQPMKRAIRWVLGDVFGLPMTGR